MGILADAYGMALYAPATSRKSRKKQVMIAKKIL